jgi:hypothetical protein
MYSTQRKDFKGENMSSERLFAKPRPAIPVRALHFDLKGVPPSQHRFIDLLKVAKLARYNALIVEWEDTFPWTIDEGFRCETPYTPQFVRKLVATAKGMGIEVIPLVQCLGHMETPLSLSPYKHLREVAQRSDVLNPLAQGARELVEKMVDDVLALQPKPRWFHLGGDEAWSFGTHPETKAYIKKHGKGALYLHHVEPILDKLNARGIRPILWHDMMREWEGEALQKLSKKADLCVWGYQGHPYKIHKLVNKEILDLFKKNGITMWGGTAYKGADGHDVDLPDIAKRQENALGWAEVAIEYKMAGVIATAWSRYSTHEVQCEPIDGALDSLLNVGVILHDGQPPRGGIEACVAALDKINEKKRFGKCRDALKKLAELRRKNATQAIALREAITMARIDPRRRSSGGLIRRITELRNLVSMLEAASRDVEHSLKGLIEPVWIQRYLAERVKPLRDEQTQLEPHVKILDPDGYIMSKS